MVNRLRVWGTLLLAGLVVLGLARNASATWYDFTGGSTGGPFRGQIAVANTKTVNSGVPPAGGIVCGVVYTQDGIDCRTEEDPKIRTSG